MEQIEKTFRNWALDMIRIFEEEEMGYKADEPMTATSFQYHTLCYSGSVPDGDAERKERKALHKRLNELKKGDI